MIKLQGIEESKRGILSAKDILITGHKNPDGDSIGSLLALGLGLEKLGKRVYMVSYDGVPTRYKNLPGAKRILKSTAKKIDLAVTVDCSNKEIIGETFNTVKEAKNILEIDHHESRRPYGNIEFIDESAASVGEMIYFLLKELKIDITKDIATNLLTSIIVETISFRLPNVGNITFQVCSELLQKGVNYHDIADKVLWSKNKASVILAGICFSRCKFLVNNKIAWSIVRLEDFKKARGKDEDVDPIADELRSIKEVKIVVLFREKDKKHLRVSLRSKGKINVATLAEKYNGGGHFDVAGCSIPNNQKTIEQFLKQTEQLLK